MATSARGRHLRDLFCTRLPLDAAAVSRLWQARVRLPPTRDRPSARPGSSVAWPTLLPVHTLSAAAGFCFRNAITGKLSCEIVGSSSELLKSRFGNMVGLVNRYEILVVALMQDVMGDQKTSFVSR
ncbi:hypothetical protein B296_00013921 [Ensete ventricosum]|uniref:Uncharacterized protein n=1 Tax=Ensete ventricosum TaxID=4639 RepID=A0A427AEA2_ENSVE|nr:hypothetical protein B296_00013921 [Ensete ventricosum]